MDRRTFVKASGAGVAAGGVTIAAPAIAQAQPKVSWRLTSSFPKSLDTTFGGGTHIAKRVAGSDGQPVPDPGLRAG